MCAFVRLCGEEQPGFEWTRGLCVHYSNPKPHLHTFPFAQRGQGVRGMSVLLSPYLDGGVAREEEDSSSVSSLLVFCLLTRSSGAYSCPL